MRTSNEVFIYMSKFVEHSVSEEIPTHGKWLQSIKKDKKCKLCGINIIFKDTEFCCEFYSTLYDKLDEYQDVLNVHGWILDKWGSQLKPS